MTRVAILQSNYIPWKGYFDIIKNVDVFLIYDEVQYTKNDWRNRNMIKTVKGPEWITIPVRQEVLHQKINETVVFKTNWNVKHWNTLVTNYSKAEGFKAHRSYFQDAYLGITTPNLSEINLHFIKLINSFLGIQTQILNSVDLNLGGDKNNRLVDACKKLNADVYLSGPAAKDYLDVELFSDHNIQVQWMDYSNYPEYPQLFGDFVHGVSVLDLIFNTGKNAITYMKTL